MRGPNKPATTRARSLRQTQTSAEAKLWSKLRNRQLAGAKFVRQEPIGPCFADFCCREQRLVVELDGATHSTDAELARDAKRTHFLEAQAYQCCASPMPQSMNPSTPSATRSSPRLSRLPNHKRNLLPLSARGERVGVRGCRHISFLSSGPSAPHLFASRQQPTCRSAFGHLLPASGEKGKRRRRDASGKGAAAGPPLALDRRQAGDADMAREAGVARLFTSKYNECLKAASCAPPIASNFLTDIIGQYNGH